MHQGRTSGAGVSDRYPPTSPDSLRDVGPPSARKLVLMLCGSRGSRIFRVIEPTGWVDGLVR